MKPDRTLIQATIPFAKEIRTKSWVLTLSTFFIAAISLALLMCPINWILKIPISLLLGLVYVRLFVIYHDYLHETILQRSRLANVLFTIFGYIILTPKTIWKRSHNYHHTHNSKIRKAGIGSYPVYTKARFESLSKKDKRQYLFIRHPFTILLGYYFTFLKGMCIDSLRNGFKRHIDSFYALLVHFGFHAAIFIFFGWQGTLFCSVIPHFIAGALGTYLFYAQHNFPEVHYQVNEDWTYEGAALESSSFLNTNRFMHWVTANIGYHHIHHLNARIPFYRLPEIMEKIVELQSPKRTSLMPSDILKCLKLKIWDEELKRMVSV